MIEAAGKSLQCEDFGGPAEISILLTDDEYIREMNREYRGIDRPTDVLAFSQLEGERFGPEAECLLGDVIISVERAKAQAGERSHSLADELDLLVIHGVLHLLGYDDETGEQASRMRQREKAILEELCHGRAA